MRIAEAVRDDVLAACRTQTVEQLSAYDDSGPGDTAFAVDRVSEERLVELVEQLGVPVLLVADHGQKGLVLRGFDLGANDHVIRPVDPNELRARVRNQIRRKRYQERLRADLDRSLEMAVTDPLTGLRNRRYVRRHLEGVLRNSGAAVLLMDVDKFKSVNDTHGHAAGDLTIGGGRVRDQVAEGGGDTLITCGLSIRDVAGDVLQRKGLCLQTADRSIQCVENTHTSSPTRSRRRPKTQVKTRRGRQTTSQDPCQRKRQIISAS